VSCPDVSETLWFPFSRASTSTEMPIIMETIGFPKSGDNSPTPDGDILKDVLN
jgi:hypothetical protein